MIQFESRADSRQRSVYTHTRIVELITFAWLLPIAGLVIFPDNPIGLESGFPWIIAGPVIFAARYGSAWGALCSLLAAVLFLIPFPAYTSMAADLSVLTIGTLFISVVVGDTANTWRRKSQKLKAENQYLKHRFKEFSTDYHVLKVSHGLLEEHMAGQRLSLREALQQLKTLLKSSPDDSQIGKDLMAVFSHFCSIQVAGLYTISDGNSVKTEPVATHGRMVELPLFDPLLKAAIDTREVASIKLEVLAEKHLSSSLLAVVPLVGSDGHLHGVLAIKDMHFMAFQQRNLNLLALLGYYVGNQLSRTHSAALSQFDFFYAELETALRFAHTQGTESVLLCLRFGNHPEVEKIAEFVNLAIRGLDASLLLTGDDNTPVLSLLLPLMSESSGIKFMQRINTAVDEEFGIPLQDVLAGSALHEIDSAESLASCLKHLVDEIGPIAVKMAMQGKTLAQEQSDAA